MKLYHSPHSPFVRKISIAAEFLGLSAALELIPARGNLMVRDPLLRAMNPSGQIPILLTDDDGPIFDSPVICAYLEAQAGGGLTDSSALRWRDLRDQAIGDGMLDAALQCRYESALRPESLRWPDWLDAWRNKVEDSCQALAARATELQGRRDIGAISIFCALAYIDSRLQDVIDLRDAWPDLMSWFDDFAAIPEVSLSDPNNFK